MAKDILYANVMPTELSPVATGNAKADDAIRVLQAWPPGPIGKVHKAAMRVAEKVDPAKLLELLDDAAVATGQSRWSDKHLSSLGTGDRRVFKKHYDAVVSALTKRKAYLQWLIGAVCNTPAGLERALEIVLEGTVTARLLAAAVLWEKLEDPQARRRFADALDLRAWSGKPPDLQRMYAQGVATLAELDRAEVYDRHAALLEIASERKEAARGEALLFGLIAYVNGRASDKLQALDPRWTSAMLPLLDSPLDNLAIMVLQQLPPDPMVVEPLCAYLPKPGAKGYWNGNAVEVLARAADHRALPWLVGALQASWMNWPAVFEGFRRVGDPAMAHVMREWLRENSAPDRDKVAKPIIKALEAKGPAPAPTKSAFVQPKPTVRKRPVLAFRKARKFKGPKLDSLAVQTKVLAARFADAGLGDEFERITERCVWMIPTRVDESKLAIGGTKLGGHPDLPAATEWPRVKREPLTFLAQISLAEVNKLLPKGQLPTSGLLSFFMGNNPEGAAGYCENMRVILTSTRSKLVRHEVPEDFVDVIYQAATVTLHPGLSLPSPSNRHLTKRLKGARRDSYEQEVYGEPLLLPQLLGYRVHGYDAEEPATARMLLQLPGDDQTEMQFGDVDALSCFIAIKKLAERDFGKVWPHLGD
jgi:hypothetical protein